MRRDLLVYWFSWLNTMCWLVCFWWMHRISSRQNAFLKELKEQGFRIEGLSKVEHDMLKEVHPQVGEIKAAVADVGEIKQAVTEVMETRREQPEGKPPPK